jgi:DNA-binding winged helix-turn-helix (wHTH) protein/Tol biopolymer transport system component
MLDFTLLSLWVGFMELPSDNRGKVRFGVFELDCASQEVWKRGSPVHLQEKPLRLLSLLLEHPGQVVTREEVRRRLWSSDTFVEFDEGVNAAVSKVRYVLGDSADKPVYFETVRGKGYRWIAPLQFIEDVNGAAGTSTERAETSSAADDSGPQREFGSDAALPPKKTFLRIAPILAAITLLVGITAYRGTSPRTAVPQIGLRQRQLTTNSQDNPVSANAISPDGKYLAYADLKGLHIKLTTTGEVRDVSNPALYEKDYVEWGIPQNWLPDGTRFVVNTNLPFQAVSTWIVSVFGSAPRKIQDALAPWSVSPNGKIAYTARAGRMGDQEIWITDDDGRNSRKLINGDEDSGFSMLVWSPDGKRIAYLKDHDHSGTSETSIESIDLRTNVSKIIVPTTALKDLSSLPSNLRSLVWLPDGRLIYSTGVRDPNGFSCNYWQVHVDWDNGHHATEPVPLTNWAGFCLLNVGSADTGKKLVFQKIAGHRTVFVADFDNKAAKITVPKPLTNQEAQEHPTGWTRDSREIIFSSNRNGGWQLLSQAFGTEKPEFIASGLTEVADQTPISPDGSFLLNTAMNSDGQTGRQVSRIPLTGGAPEVLTTGSIVGVRCALSPVDLCVMAENSPDHKQFVFSRLHPFRGRGSELARRDCDITADYEWALSPDGTTIAFAKQFDNTILLISTNGQPLRQVHVKGWLHLRNITYAVDGKHLFASHPSRRGAVLLFISLNGTAKPLWELAGQNVYLRAISSPNGRHLAILGSRVENNVWMMENF